MELKRLTRHAFRSAWSRTILGGALLSALLVVVVAQAASYVYDADGRLRAVTSSSGASSTYAYDALGNLLSVQSVPASQLAIFAFTPNRGPVGLTGVAIAGQGFSTTKTNNAVKFNGTAATVTSATATQLVVTVPAGATTGPISVTVGTNTATSADTFVITSDDGGLPPTIASFSPTVAMAGTTVAVAGNHFVTTAGTTQAGVGQYVSTVTPISDTQLSFSVSAQAGSGNVTVTTPYGSTQSAQPLIVVPTSVGASNVITTANLVVGGAAQALNISTANQYGAVTFQGAAGQWLSLQYSQVSTTPSGNSLYVTVYEPSGAVLVRPTSFSASPPLSLHLPQLPQNGTYLALINADTGATAQFSVAVESSPLLGSTSTTVTSAVVGQTKRMVFEGIANQYLGLNFTSVATTPSGSVIYIQPYDPTAPYDSPWNTTTQAYFNVPEVYNFLQMPSTGIGTAVIRNLSGATMSVQVATITNPVGSVTNNGSTLTQSTTAPNEDAYFTFAGTAGQNLSLGIGTVTTTPSASYVAYYLMAPNGQLVANETCYLPGCHFPITNLPQTGTYLVQMYPNQPVAMSYKVTLSSDLTGTLTPNTAHAVSLARPGQIAQLTFAGTTGQYESLYLNSVATVPSGGNVTITVTRPDGTLFPGGSTKTTTSGILNLPLLPQTGNYTVQVEADNADTATAQLTLVPDPTNALTINGLPVTQSTTDPNEQGYYTFSATAGQNVTLSFSNVTLTPSTTGALYALVIWPNGGEYASPLTATVAAGGQLSLTNLSLTGTYTVVVYPSSPATMGYTATLTSP
ncbi:MAG: IPT/TIG domain-containing protein [Rudaea sp.]|nr:IPT/TIG domain-containing protein [Rudaea sp.]